MTLSCCNESHLTGEILEISLNPDTISGPSQLIRNPREAGRASLYPIHVFVFVLMLSSFRHSVWELLFRCILVVFMFSCFMIVFLFNFASSLVCLKLAWYHI